MNAKELVKAGELLISAAMKHGATGAACSISASESAGVSVRSGALEDITLSSDRGCSMQVFIGDRSASVTSDSLLSDDLDRMALDAVAMAKETTPNEFVRLAGEDLWPCSMKELPTRLKALEFDDGAPLLSMNMLVKLSRELDRASVAVPGVARSAGSGFSHTRGITVEMTSLGFRATTRYGHYGKGTSVVAEEGGEMHPGGDGHGAHFFEDLRLDEECAQRAGKEAIAQLGARPVPTMIVPTVFDRDVAPMLLRLFFASIRADKVHLKTTFLHELLRQQVFSPEVTIVDDPHLPRKLGSRLFDAECVGTKKRTLVDGGVLTTWAADIESGGKLKMQSTGHASGASNLSMLPGTISREELIADISEGFLVTGLMGHGANFVTGAFSVGASGFLIERGVITRPVNKVTIAGNLLEMFRTLRPASDMSDGTSTNAPTCLIAHMTVGGS